MDVVSGAPVWGWILVGLFSFVILIAILSLCCRPKYFPLRNKVVVITGGSSGIGKAAAKAALAQGAHVALLARKSALLASAAAELESDKRSSTQRISTHVCDVTDEAGIREAVARGVCAEHGPVIDVLINSAGISMPRRFEETPAAEFLDIYKLNVFGSRNAVLACLPFMTNPTDGGRIVFISSQAGLVGIYGYSAYSASKFALNGFAQSLQHEVYKRNIRVSVCFPPDTDTPLLASENLQKPLVTKLLSEATATVQADAVGTALLQGINRWSPFIPIGFDGWMLSTLTAGMAPAGSFWGAFVQVMTMGLWRFVGLFYVQSFFGIIEKHDGAGAASAATAAPAAGPANAAKLDRDALPAVGTGSKKGGSSLSQPLVEDSKRK